MMPDRPNASTLAIEYQTLPPFSDSRIVMLHEPASELALRYRLLRHRLFSAGDPRVVAVTSARPGQGKTTCASNLALALAEDTMGRVLLLEANLRRPALARMFGFEPAVSFMGDMARFTRAIPPYRVVGLHGARLHLAALPAVPIYAAYLERRFLWAALFDLRRAYDYVVIDAGSVLEGEDTDVVAQSVDGILLARAGASSKADVRRALDQLRANTVLGTVLLDV
jgi:Mrp family chromosome partitioning ATPase